MTLFLILQGLVRRNDSSRTRKSDVFQTDVITNDEVSESARQIRRRRKTQVVPGASVSGPRCAMGSLFMTRSL